MKIGYYEIQSHTTPDKFLTFGEVVEMATNPLSLAKGQGPALTPHTAPGKTNDAVLRHDQMTACWVDIDDGNLSLDAVKSNLAALDVSALIYSTASSMRLNKKGDGVNGKRWRVLFELAKPIGVERYISIQQGLMHLLGGDGSASRKAQFFYAPTKPPISDPRETQHYQYALIKGQSLDAERLPKALIEAIQAVERAASKAKAKDKAATEAAFKKRDRGQCAGNFTIDEANKRLVDVVSLFDRYHYKKIGKKWLSPNSSSLSPGVHLFDDGRWYSHHSSDSMMGVAAAGGGRCGDAFDLVCWYEYGGQDKALLSLANLLDPDGQQRRQREHQEAKEAAGYIFIDDRAGMRAPPPTATTATTSADKTAGGRATPGFEAVADDYNTLQHLQQTPANPLDFESNYHRLDLLKHLDDDCWLKQFALQTARQCDLPESTVFLNVLGIYSSVACRQWVVEYATGGKLAIGLYVATEQPSGAGKSRCQNIAQAPFRKIKSELIEELKKRLAQLNDSSDDLTDDEKKARKNEREALESSAPSIHLKPFTTNATPEGLENDLKAAGGYFSCVASEQGLFDSLLGNLYKQGSANNNDLLLNGFDGGYVGASRVTRNAYSGPVIGGVTLFAQHGSVEKVLAASNGTGLAERFLMLAEPHNLGKRDHLKRVYVDEELFAEYQRRCDFAREIYTTPVSKRDLLILKLSERGYSMLGTYRNQIEPDLDDGNKFSQLASLRGAAGKIDMQILKIAANLHLLTRADAYDCRIDDSILSAAIGIADDILNGSLSICIAKGLIGKKSEYVAILKMFEGTKLKDTPTERQIIQSRSVVSPFKDSTGNKSQLVRQTLHEMCDLKILAKLVRLDDNATCYRLAQ